MRNLISSNMAALTSSAVLVLLSLLCSSHALSVDGSGNHSLVGMEDNDLIESTCRKTPNYQLCLSILQSDPRSSATDVGGLARILVDAIKAKATSTVDTINKLKKSKPEYNHQLNNCSESYNYILKDFIPETMQALRVNPRFAEAGIDGTADKAEQCEDGFKSSKSPITHENKLVYNLAVVARAIIMMLF